MGKTKTGVARLGRGLSVTLLFLCLAPRALDAQAARARIASAQENFRKDPNGRILATVLQGSEFSVVSERGGWVQIELEGWVWGASLAETDRSGFDLSVSIPRGENLRSRPQGTIVARLRQGVLLDQVAASGSWIRVNRRGWVWKGSLAMIEGADSSPVAAGGTGPGTGSNGAGSEEADDALPFLSTPIPVAVHANPDGDTVAVFIPGSQARVLGRTGDWIQLRIDGWVYAPAVLDSAFDLLDTGDLSPAQLRSDPARYKGALIRWRVQFISLRRAEAARSDFEKGEPYLLTRGPAGDPGYVYLAVPEELLVAAEALQPLKYVTVVGRVRTGRSVLLGNPVIDLTDIEPAVASR